MKNALTWGLSSAAIAGTAFKGVEAGARWAGRSAKAHFAANSVKNRSKNMEKQLKDAGVDTDALFNSQKGELIKKALANYQAGMITGGKANAETKFIATILDENRKRNS